MLAFPAMKWTKMSDVFLLCRRPESPDSFVPITFNVLSIMESSDGLDDHIDNLFTLSIKKQSPVKAESFFWNLFSVLEVEPRDLNTPVCALPVCYTPSFEKSRIVGTDKNPGIFWLNRVFKFHDAQDSFSSHSIANWINLESLVFLFCFISKGILSLKYWKIDLSISWLFRI